jgi:hypothetical protein
MRWKSPSIWVRPVKLSAPSVIATTLLLTSLIVGCASSAARSVPQLGERTLYLSLERPGFAKYGYCLKYKLFSEKCKEWHWDWYDLTSAAQVKELNNLGYRLTPKAREY